LRGSGKQKSYKEDLDNNGDKTEQKRLTEKISAKEVLQQRLTQRPSTINKNKRKKKKKTLRFCSSSSERLKRNER